MNTTKPTPGPWVANGRYVGTPTHMASVAECCNDANLFHGNDAKACANARLIAAAPELLEALRKIGSFDSDEIPQWKGASAFEVLAHLQSQARAAIQKATGATP